MKILELSLRNYRVFEQVDLELPARVIGIFGPNGAGKCLPNWTRVWDADMGEALPIEQFVQERRKRTVGLRDGRVEPIDVTDWFQLGDRPTVILTLANGLSFELADTHPVLTDRGSIRARDLTPGDWVAEARSMPACGPARLSVDEAMLVGLLLGDGYLNKSVSFSAVEPSVIELFRSSVERVFPGSTINAPTRKTRATTWRVVSRLDREERQRRIVAVARRLVEAGVPLGHYLGANVSRFIRGHTSLSYELFIHIEEEYGLDLYEDQCALFGGRVFFEWARGLGLLGLVAATKRVPRDLLLLPDEQVRAMVAGLWLTDGWIIPQRGTAAFGTDSEGLARDVRVLLLRLGIVSNIRTHDRVGQPPRYRVNVTTGGARQFGQLPLVGPKAKKVQSMLEGFASRRFRPNHDLIPPSFNKTLATTSTSGRYRSRKQLDRHAMSREVFNDFGGDATIAQADTAWSRVVRVSPTGRKVPCFDITVDTNEHLYLADTLIVHNSALVESVLYALYGRARTAKQEIRTQGVLTDCEIRLVFQHGGQQYEVRRTIRGKNHQTDAEILVGDLSLAVGVQEVDAEIRRLLRMDHQVFRASVFAEQKQLDAFSDLTKARRKAMVLRLLGIKPVDEARTAARQSARETKRDADRLAEQLPDAAELESRLKESAELAAKAREAAKEAAKGLEEATSRLHQSKDAFEGSEGQRIQTERIAALRAEVEDKKHGLERRHAELQERVVALTKALVEMPTLEKELAGLGEARERLEAGRRLQEAAERLGQLEREAEALPEVDPAAALAELEAAEATLKEAERAAARAETGHERAREELRAGEALLEGAGELDPTKPCPTCGQPLGAAFRDVVAHRRNDVAELRKTAAAAGRTVREAEAARKTAQKGSDAARRVGEAARRAAQQREHLEKQLHTVRVEVEKLAAPFEGEAPNVAALEAAATRADELSSRAASLRAEQKHLAHAEKDTASVEKDLSVCDSRLEDLAKEASGLDFNPTRHAELQAQFDEATGAFEQARNDERHASDGAKDSEKEVAALEADLNRVKEVAAQVGEIREEARYVERVTLLLDGFRDHLVSRIGPELSREAEALFRELTNHEYEDLRIDEEDLSIRVADAGAYFPIERFSGSEADLANLALRVAISMHLSRMSGADIGMMVLDEVLGSLDEERKDLMVQAMGRLADRFHQLFVITHAEQVKDQFGASVEVRKVGRRRSEAVLV